MSFSSADGVGEDNRSLYPIEEGKLYGGEYPGHRDPDVAKIRLRSLITLGIRSFVDLTAPADRIALYEGLLTELAEEAIKPHLDLHPYFFAGHFPIDISF